MNDMSEANKQQQQQNQQQQQLQQQQNDQQQQVAIEKNIKLQVFGHNLLCSWS